MGITVSQIASECRQIKAKEGKLGLVVVDYLQMMAEDSGGNRSYELGDVARGREQRDFVRLGEKGAMPSAGAAIANKYI